MDFKKRILKDAIGNRVVPITSPKAVVDETGKTLDIKLFELETAIFNINSGALINQWSEKTWNVMGDSITEGYLTTNTYHEYVKDLLGIGTVNNYGIISTCLAEGGSLANSTAICNRVGSMAVSGDLITVFGGANDYGGEVQTNLGTMLDTDKNTIYGALHSICQTLYTTFPQAKYALFTPLQRSDVFTANSGVITVGKGINSKGYTLEQVADAIIKVGDYYSIPVLDLYHESNLMPAITAHKTTFMPDGLHPNAQGHYRLAIKIAEFLRGL